MPNYRAAWWRSADRGSAPPDIDVTKPSIARVYDQLLGGKDHFPADREVGERIRDAMPAVAVGVEEQRAMLRRVVRFLVADCGVRQLVDIGSGLPTAGNVHEVAHELDPGVRVVYVDDDPIVLAHARALLAKRSGVIVIDGDLRRPETIFGDPQLRRLIDLEQPVGLLLCGILHHIQDDEDPVGITDLLRGALTSGSYLFVHHLVDTGDPEAAGAQAAMRKGLGRGQFRTFDQIRRFFGDFELVEPGLVLVPEWRPDAATRTVASNPVLRTGAGAVGRKP